MTWRFWAAFTLIAAAFAIMVGLGTWQMQRLAWKERLIAAVSERTSLPATDLPMQADANTNEYQPVTVSGRYHPDKEVRLYTVLGEPKGFYRGPGWLIITPLERDDGSFILINRGFVPIDRISDPAGWQATTSPVTVTGLLRLAEHREPFAATDQPQKREFFTRDPAAMAKAVGIKAPAVTIDAQAQGQGILPQGGETRLVFPNRHLEYALTWYGLAASLVGVGAAFAWGRAKRRDKAPKNI